MASIALFLVGVLSLLFFDPTVTAYIHGEPSYMWRFVTFFTHMVSHGSWGHLFGNYIFGAPFMLYLEYKLKSTKKFVRLFFALGACAFIFQAAFNYLSAFKSLGLIGSSGAIFGLVGAALSMYDGPKPVRLAARCLLAFYLFSQLQLAMISLIFPMGIAYAAHFGGLVGGVLFTLHHRHHRRRLSRHLRNLAKRIRR